MIRYLDKLSFAEFGTALSDNAPNRGLPKEPGWTTQKMKFSSESAQVYHLSAPTYLDFEEDMAVLVVSRDGENMEYFYLDKPVMLNAGVYFAIISYGKQCVVRVGINGADSWKEAFELHQSDIRLQISQQLEIGSIFTLFYQEKEKGFFFKGEKHEAIELLYVDKGMVHSVVNGLDMVLNQGEMVIYGSGQWHMQYADKDVAASFITITFDIKYKNMDLLLNRKFSLRADSVALLRQMLEERDRDDEFSSDMILCNFKKFLLTVLRDDSKTENKLKTSVSIYNENEIVNRALTYIGKNVYSKLSVAEVAKQIDISTPYLTALFRQRLQISPGEYIRRTKLEESKELIKEGRMNFTQIAEALHYSSVHHFSRQFKDKFGLTPSEYARAIR